MIGLDLVGGNHRRGFGDAIAFQQGDAAFLAHKGPGFVTQSLGAAHRQAQGLQVILVSDTGILVDEGVGGQHYGGAVMADAAHDLFRLQRCGVCHHLYACDQRQERADRKPKAMEDRQGIEQHIGGIKIDMGTHLRHIGEDVHMAQCHALGLTFGAGGEQDHGRFVRIGLGRQSMRHQLARHRRQLVAQGKLFAHVFQIDDLDAGQPRDQVLQAGNFHQAAGGDHALHLGGAQGAFQACRAQREIQHGGNAAEGR